MTLVWLCIGLGVVALLLVAALAAFCRYLNGILQQIDPLPGDHLPDDPLDDPVGDVVQTPPGMPGVG